MYVYIKIKNKKVYATPETEPTQVQNIQTKEKGIEENMVHTNRDGYIFRIGEREGKGRGKRAGEGKGKGGGGGRAKRKTGINPVTCVTVWGVEG